MLIYIDYLHFLFKSRILVLKIKDRVEMQAKIKDIVFWDPENSSTQFKKVLNGNSDHRIQLYIDSENFMQKYLSVVEFYSFKISQFYKYRELRYWWICSILVVFWPHNPHLNSYWALNH